MRDQRVLVYHGVWLSCNMTGTMVCVWGSWVTSSWSLTSVRENWVIWRHSLMLWTVTNRRRNSIYRKWWTVSRLRLRLAWH